MREGNLTSSCLLSDLPVHFIEMKNKLFQLFCSLFSLLAKVFSYCFIAEKQQKSKNVF